MSMSLFAVSLLLLTVIAEKTPVLIQTPSHLSLTKGETIRSQCVLKNHDMQKIHLIWYQQRPGDYIKRIMIHYQQSFKRFGVGNRFYSLKHLLDNRCSLLITRAKLSDSAVYTCGMYGNILGAGTVVTVTVSDKPELIQLPTVQHVTEGHPAWLQCSMERINVSSTNVHWHRQIGKQILWILSHSKNDKIIIREELTQRLQSSRVISNNTYILNLANVTASDAAIYFCSILEDIWGDGTQLNVTGALPILVQSPTLQRVTEGRQARLQCSMEKANVSSTDVHWYRQLPGQQKEWILTHDRNGRKADHEYANQRLQPSRVSSNNTYILMLRRVTLNDAAVYHCCVWGDVCGDGTKLNVTMSREQVWITMGSALGGLACVGAAFLIYKMCSL